MIDIPYNNKILVGGLLASLAAIAITGTFSMTDIGTEENTMDFMTGDTGASQHYHGGISNGVKMYGDQIYLDNLEVETVSAGDPTPADKSSPVAYAHWGEERKPVYHDTDTVEFKNGRIMIGQLEAMHCWYAGCTNREYINNILWTWELEIDKDQITADITDIEVQDVGQGEKKIDANVLIENNFNPVEVQKMYVKAFDQTIDLDTGIISEGEHEYEITASQDFYDSTEFIRNEEVETEVSVHFKDAEVPQSMISGKPEMDGDFRTYESFEEGGDKPDVSNIKEGDFRYGQADSPCDIQYLWRHGLDTRDCKDYSGGSSEPMSTQNHPLRLEDFQSNPETVQTKVQYCGENATFVDGECVIDEEIHLRGDLCPLLEEHQIVTQTFNEGTYSQSDLEPEPSFFCTKHPVLVTESEGEQTEFITEPYRKMVDGGGFTVPEGQTYTLYWTTNTEENNIDTVCEQGSFNPETGDCEVTQGVVHQCSTGVWNPETGSCVVHPEVEPICEEGRYNAQTDTCNFEADSAAECGTGSYENGMCYQQANVKQVCPDDADMTDGVCQDEAVVLVQNSVLDSARLLVYNIVGTVSEIADNTVSTLLFWS